MSVYCRVCFTIKAEKTFPGLLLKTMKIYVTFRVQSWCHLFTVRCHFLTDDILIELQGISLNDVTGLILEHFGIV
jgi:hypothetical protein